MLKRTIKDLVRANCRYFNGFGMENRDSYQTGFGFSFDGLKDRRLVKSTLRGVDTVFEYEDDNGIRGVVTTTVAAEGFERVITWEALPTPTLSVVDSFDDQVEERYTIDQFGTRHNAA